nr:SNARE associated Golgi protein [uncultured bacterium]ALS89310.1 SNARE associated Golgi protein [uncultured bacterium]
MAQGVFEVLRAFFDQYGYWTVAIALLLENAGIPVPGETVLLFASFLAYSEQSLRLPYIILIGIVACTVGDNIGYIIGKRGGRPLLERYQRFFRIRSETIAKGERLFGRYGSVTILFARFIFGLRIIAGPLAGVLQMPWRQFAIFNLLGAVVWVTAISCIGYFVGTEWTQLLRVVKHINTGVLIVAVLVFVAIWWRRRQQKSTE